MKYLCISMYVFAAISTANMAYMMDVCRCRTAPPVQYVILGAGWPLLDVVLLTLTMFGKKLPSNCEVAKS